MPVIVKSYDRAARSWTDFITVDVLGVRTDAVKAYQVLTNLSRRPDFTLRSSWPGIELPLRRSVARMLRGEGGRVFKSGRPAFLATATCAALLDEKPERIADLLDNFRHPRRRQRTHG